ncbi:hypothetical protein BgiMline_023691 [Biomphalaria glabrata]|nr:hypothetical protein BgiMline_006933 [Biomphalaria glabrata]
MRMTFFYETRIRSRLRGTRERGLPWDEQSCGFLNSKRREFQTPSESNAMSPGTKLSSQRFVETDVQREWQGLKWREFTFKIPLQLTRDNEGGIEGSEAVKYVLQRPTGVKEMLHEEF